MREIEVDVAVIGAGSAGLRAYRSAAQYAKRVVLIEGGDYGTTCARVGCMPSKLLIAAAESAHHARGAAKFGIRVAEPEVDGRAVMERVRTERDRFVGKATAVTQKIPEADRLHGHARFEDRNTLRVGDDLRVRAGSVVIATGSRPQVLPMFEGLGDRLVVNDDIFDWMDLPESVVVFGPGVIGLELGQALQRLGVRVRMFGIGGFVGPLTDPDVKAMAERHFQSEFPLDADSRVESVAREGDQVVVRFRDGEDELREEHFEYLLAATGRRPNVDRLDIGNAGLALDDQGLPVFDRYTLQCGDSSVFIAGDANNHLPLLHEAADEGVIAGRNAARFPEVAPGHRHCPLSIVFTDPQIAMVGDARAELEEGTYAVGELDFSAQARARVMGEDHGLMRVYGRYSDGRFLGAEIFTPRAEHMAHLLAWCREQGLTVAEMIDKPYYHPVLEEGLRNALQMLQSRLEQGRGQVRP
ncbi:dihydrolipoyl dehydrogenase [Alkalilimnicola ehrlichii MLHE-1]|uniref:Pyridine nucleotide-disulfide oxidoreductase dimerization region n=1 Tax=Alkalilimnicola ehrlichii (strain ATCC BAA-1101 / DSM 17681 / MLHE-1) TaxID=187272 RepID=Q0A9F7_ALKEH|nr:dihydrolipoyl dehydrogenase [Alkalilimnicola ehrlichii]ABI56530.1 pyridine nucleotide-disulfide oxidoreductase dimerization region [Alkalilimnicola ehrlichii MLHE-1]